MTLAMFLSLSKCGSGLRFLAELSDGRRDTLRGYSQKARLGIFRSLDANTYFSLWQCTLLGACPANFLRPINV